MAASNDMKLNIQVNGDNRGFKNTLNQSTQDLKRFMSNAEKTMSGGGGIRAGLTALATAGGAYAASKALPRVRPNFGSRTATEQAFMSTRLSGVKLNAINELKAQNRSMRKGHPGRPDLEVSNRHIEFQANQRERAAFLRTERKNRRVAKRHDMKQDVVRAIPGILKTASVVAAVGAVGAAVAVSEANKWMERMNQAMSQYSGRVISVQSRLDAQNMRKDIAMARDPFNLSSREFALRAKNFRQNTGFSGSGAIANYAGGALDTLMGVGKNAMFGLPGLIMNIKGATESFGGIK